MDLVGEKRLLVLPGSVGHVRKTFLPKLHRSR